MLPWPAPTTHRARRRLLALPVGVALTLSLAACGGSSTPAGASDGPAGLDAFSITGDVGTEPTVDLQSPVNASSKVETETVAAGDGDALAAEDTVMVNYSLIDGYDGTIAQQSYGAENAGVLVTVGAAATQPTTVDSLVTNVAQAMVTPGTTVGSRIVSTGTATDLLGVPGIAEIGIGNLDPVVLVVDVLAQPLTEPAGKKIDPPAWVPGLKITDDKPVTWTFENTPAPSDKLRVYSRIVGTGPKVAKGDLLVANYLGQVYGGDKPFDESYSRGMPIGFGIGLNQVIKGWDKALVGIPVGSRVVLAIPPKLGYGDQGNPQAGIKGTDTLYFLIDVLGAA